jgi:hypothetical protein
MKVKREFRCRKCGRVEIWSADAKPHHCDEEMQPGELGQVRPDDAVKIDIVKMKNPPAVKWQIADEPKNVWTVYILRPGTTEGWEQASEKLGWLAERTFGYEWKMVEGVHPSGGMEPTRNKAVEKMFEAMEG